MQSRIMIGKKKTCAVIFIMALFLLTGCVAGESEQKKAGQALLKEYFSSAGKKASINSLYADITRPDADRLEMSDYVKGTYKLDNEEYEFWVNVETGSIYTSERLEEFGKSVLKVQAEKLGFDADGCTCYAAVTIDPEFTGETGNSRGQTDTVTLNDVLPVTIDNMDEFAIKTLESEHVSVRSFIVCRNNPVTDDAKESEIPEWHRDQITICVQDDPGAELPTDEYDILRFWGDNRENCVELKY